MNHETQVTLFFGATGGYATITRKGSSLSVRLDPDKRPADSLVHSADEMRERAARLLQRAELIDRAVSEM